MKKLFYPARAALLALMFFALPEAARGQENKPDEEAGLTQAHFVSIRPIIVPILQNHRLQGLMSVEINLKLEDPEKNESIMAIRPKLVDRYLIALNQLGQAAIEVDRPLNYVLLETVLQRSTDHILGPAVARVLIVDASTRPM